MLEAVPWELLAMAKLVRKLIKMPQPAKLGASQLTAGEYRLLIDGTKVTIQKDNKLVAEVAAHWEQRGEKGRYNSVLLGANGELKEVRFAGENRVLVLE